jgi:hypothetical protein
LNRSARLVDDPLEKQTELFIEGLQNKKQILQRIEGRRIEHRGSLSAAITDTGLNPRTLLDRDQLMDCADAYTNNGIIRTAVDKTIWFIKGSRIKQLVEPNEETTQGMDDTQIRKLESKIAKDTLKQENGKPFDIRGLLKKIIRCNVRCGLDDYLNKLLTSVFVFGRGFGQIHRDKEIAGWKRYGQPMSFKPLHVLRIVDTLVDPDSYEFEGIRYNFGRKNQNKKRIDAIDLISAWHDDNNVFDNTYYSGMSPVWSALSASQTIETVLDENLPEFVKAISEGIGLLYSGTNKKSVSDQIKKEMQQSTIFIHNYEKMKFEKIDLARNPAELMDIINGLAKYICQSINLPLFLMFEDTANFATANQVMQVFKVSTLNRYRTWLQGILEKCWYNPILADHLNIDIEQVIAQDIKIKPIFEDINFETRLEVLQGEQIAFNLGVHERMDVALAIDDKKAANRIAMEDAAIEEDKERSIEETGQKPIIERTAQGKLDTRDPNEKKED